MARKRRHTSRSHSPRFASLQPPTIARPVPRLPDPRWIVAASLVALGISGYLLWGSFTSEGLPGCGPASGCDAVLTSRWSTWLGFPVSLPAILVYAGLLAALYGRARASEPRAVVWLNFSLVLGAVAILGAAVWFILLQLLVIGAICPFCLAAHACGLFVGIQILRYVGPSAGSPGKRRVPGKPVGTYLTFRQALAGGAGAFALLVLGQVLYEPPSFRIIEIAAATIQESPGRAQTGTETAEDLPSAMAQPAVSASEALVAPAAPATRLLSVHGGQFVFDLHEAPVLGSPNAPTVALHFFDYTCHHCRSLHLVLAEAHHVLGDRVALVSLPVPLEMECNPILQRPIPAHTNACIYARIGLAVWRADRAKLHTFDDWFFSFARPPSPEEARAEAGRLVGGHALAEALRDPWIDEHIAQCIRLYHTNYLVYQRQSLPLLMVGTNLVSGTLRTTNQLYSILGILP